MTANSDLGHIERPISEDNLNSSTASTESTISNTSTNTSQQASPQPKQNDELFQIAAKAEKLLQEILSAGKKSPKQEPVKQEPQAAQIHATNIAPPVIQQLNNINPQFAQIQQNGQYYGTHVQNGFYPPTHQHISVAPPSIMPHPHFGFPPPVNLMHQPPANHINIGPGGIQSHIPYYYQLPGQHGNVFFPPIIPQYNTGYLPQQQHVQLAPHQYQSNPMQQFSQHPPQILSNYVSNNNNNKRKFGDINTYINNNGAATSTISRFKSENNYNTNKSVKNDEACSSDSPNIGIALAEEDDLNLIRERELKDLKCKSVVEKMSVFQKYYQQFKESYIHRVYTLECSDSLKIQFHSLIKYLNEYEGLLGELSMMITEHERECCKNNHRKTKKFFNKTKAFIRYECNKRLQSNIFEYRRLINSQDRYAGMYDLLDMNSYLISLLPDIGVSIRRYINRCEKAKEQAQLDAEEEEDTFQAQWDEVNSNDSGNNESHNHDVGDITIPTFKEFVATHGNDDEETRAHEGGEELSVHPIKLFKEGRNYESFSMGVDSLNRYLLKRVEEEETLDELVKERIIKWINKRQAKYILIFCEVDKLLNQHKAGECYSKFHSYLLFNLGKLITVCDSYHQKLKELLYSTTIRRKKKRKKVKLLPEAMSDVFEEINDLKRSLEYAKNAIKRCPGKSQQQAVVQETEVVDPQSTNDI